MAVTQQRGLRTGRRGLAAEVAGACNGAGVGAAPFHVLSIRATDPWVGVGAQWWALMGFDREGGGEAKGVLSAHLIQWSLRCGRLGSAHRPAGVWGQVWSRWVWALLALCFARDAVTGPGEQGLRVRPGTGTEDTCLEFHL